MVLMTFLFAGRLTSHRVNDIDCTRLLDEFNCVASTVNRNDTNHNINRDVTEISGQSDEIGKNSQMSVIHNDVCDNEESVCCDVESGLSSVVQDSQVEESNPIPGACDERTVGRDSNLVADNGSEFLKENTGGGHIEEEKAEVRWAEDTDIKAEGCSNDKSSSTDKQNKLGNVQEQVEYSDLKPQACDGVESNQLHVSESEGHVHIHVESNALNNAETFNTFQYWRVPIPELQLDISLAETGKSTAVHVKAKVTDEAAQLAFATDLNFDMDIDVSSL